MAVIKRRGGNHEKGAGDEELKKERMVGSRLPEELIQDLEKIEAVEQTDRSTTVRKLLSKAVKEWKLEYYGRQYGEGKMSRARAAREAGVSLWEMMDYLSKAKITAQYDLDDLQHDVETIERWHGIGRKDE